MKSARILLFLLLAGLIGAAFFFRARLNLDTLHEALAAAGWGAPFLFVAAYALATIAFLPGAAFSLAGGFLFGPLWGTALSLTGALTGASAAFLIARYLAQDWVQRRARGMLATLLEGIAEEGWRFVLWVRLVPLFPFNLLNYALGLTTLPFPSYFWASALGMAPGAFVYNWLGYSGERWTREGGDAMRDVLIGLALAASLLLIPSLWRRLRRRWQWVEASELARWLKEKRSCTIIDVRSAPELRALPPIRGARHVPLDQLRREAASLRAACRDAPVVLVCHSARRAAFAADLLCGPDGGEVFVLRGGMMAWQAVPKDQGNKQDKRRR